MGDFRKGFKEGFKESAKGIPVGVVVFMGLATLTPMGPAIAGVLAGASTVFAGKYISDRKKPPQDPPAP